MKQHLLQAALLTAVLGLSTLAVGQNYALDISLEGPWILYADHFNDAKGNKVPVLVAVAPIEATAQDSDIDSDSQFHHQPQLSSGNGFYLPSPGIFCLEFDQCAPAAGPAFNYDSGYQHEAILPFQGNGTQWSSYGANNDVVILPMPNSYHADGVWPIRFHSDDTKLAPSVPDASYSIGLILHYSQSSTRLKLFSCAASATSINDCPKEAQDEHGNRIEVANTGTLRLQMRAPDTNDNCDHHVRYGYHQVLKLLDPKYTNKAYRYIEPAEGMDSNDKGIFETSTSDPCFQDDPDDQDDDTAFGAMHHAVTIKKSSEKQTDPFTQALNTINAQWPARNPQLDAKQSFLLQSARKPFNEALRLKGSLRISDVRRMGVLAEESAEQISSVIAELQLQAQRNFHDDSDEVNKLEKLNRNLKAFADGTKNGADCRAAQVQVQ